MLREFCEIVGAAIFCARAQDALQTSQSIVHDIFPQHVAKALAARAREGAEADIEEDAEATATGSDAASDPAPTPPRLSQSSGDGESATATAAARRSRFSAQLFGAHAAPSLAALIALRCAAVRAADACARLDLRRSRGVSKRHDRLCGCARALVSLRPRCWRTCARLVVSYTPLPCRREDIVGFTKLAEQRSPEAVMAMLHEAFSRFDALCTAHGVYKVRLQPAPLQ